MILCTFGQRQGAGTITHSDGITHDLVAVGDVPGKFRDQRGHTVCRRSGLGRAGQIFRFEDERLYVYWDTPAPTPVDDGNNPTAPCSTADYDATTLLRCGPLGTENMVVCPAGILRMEDGVASIVIVNGRERYEVPLAAIEGG